MADERPYQFQAISDNGTFQPLAVSQIQFQVQTSATRVLQTSGGIGVAIGTYHS